MTPNAELSCDELRARVDRIPRQPLAALPTACEELPRLAAHAGVQRFLVKRDDLTGLGLGGNKSRALEFLIADALAGGCDVLIAGGGVEQSNHARQCAAAATRAGMETIVVLQRRERFRSNGNLLALQVLGAQISWIDSDPELRDRDAAATRMEEIAAELREAGRTPYVLVSSVHPLSIVAYVDAAMELADQVGDTPTRIYATSEGAVLGGLVLAARVLGLPWDVVGVDWRPLQPGTVDRLLAHVSEAAALLGLATPVGLDDLRILPGGGPAYGEGSPKSWAALDLLARLEGLLLDPVYTAKGMAGALEHLDANPLPEGQVLFVHTGGVPALFAYEDDIEHHVLRPRRPMSERRLGAGSGAGQ